MVLFQAIVPICLVNAIFLSLDMIWIWPRDNVPILRCEYQFSNGIAKVTFGPSIYHRYYISSTLLHNVIFLVKVRCSCFQ